MTKLLTRLLIVAVIGIVLATFAAAQVVQQRPLPPQGKRGELGGPLEMPLVQIDGKALRLAPGAVLYDQSNRSIVHGALPSRADVLYTTDASGNVQRLYVLTPAEQDRLDRAPKR